MADIFVLRRYLWLLLCLGLLFGGVRSANAQTPPPTPTPNIPAYEATLTALRATVEAQDNKIKALDASAFKLWDLLSWIGVIAAGATAIWAVRKQVRDEVSKHANAHFKKVILQIDPTEIPIWIPENLQKASRLEKLGFKDLHPYNPDHVNMINGRYLSGVLVYPANNGQELQAIKAFLTETRKIPEGKIGLVVYKEGPAIVSANDDLKGFFPYTFANSHTTIAPRVMEVARLLDCYGVS